MTPIVFTVGVRTESPNRVRGTTRGAAMAWAANKRQQRLSGHAFTMHHVRLAKESIGERVTLLERRALSDGLVGGRYSYNCFEGFWTDGGAIVTIARLSAGTLDDDNLRGALKAVRDGIADALGVDDGSPLVQWVYAQRKCKRGAFGVEVRIERREETAA